MGNKALYKGIVLKLHQLGIEGVTDEDIDTLIDEISITDYKNMYEHYVNKKTFKSLNLERKDLKELNDNILKKIKIIVTRRKVRNTLQFLSDQTRKLAKEKII